MTQTPPSGSFRRIPGIFEEAKPPLSNLEAIVEAERCLRCGGPYAPAPCLRACPASVNVPGFVGAIALGDPAQAASIIFEENLLGGTCARVCPTEVLCEGACVLHHEGRRPVEIGRLQRYATDFAFDLGLRTRAVAPPRGVPIAVIGAGPAGLAAAGELVTRGYTVTVFESRAEPGGLARFAIAPYRQQLEPLPQEALMLNQMGVHFRFGNPIDTPQKLHDLEAKYAAVVLAVGLGKDVEVTYPGDELEGVWDSLPFIEAIKTGKTPKVGSEVTVIGGGNTAMDVAREALRLGANTVNVLYRRTEAEMPAFPHEVEEARAEGVHFEWLTLPIRFLGKHRLEALECQHVRLGEPDESGRRRPQPVSGTEFLVPTKTVIKAIGQRPRIEFLRWVEGLEIRDGKIGIDPQTAQTTNPHYFAAGDATGGATVVEAVRGAKLAAEGVDRYLKGGRL
ncbi:MAG: FAD-dependent oxidoreductase [Thermaceae bacterium]|nr:FAD-dependent oxidoreductase [Thermaceae bacterium]